MSQTAPTVLIIEDDELIRRLFNTVLSASGFQVLEAGDAKVGMALALGERPDLILMDIQLPGLDGLTATSLLHQQPGMQDLPIIAVTGHVTKEHQLRAVEVGCADFLAKPVTSGELLAAVKRVLARKGA